MNNISENAIRIPDIEKRMEDIARIVIKLEERGNQGSPSPSLCLRQPEKPLLDNIYYNKLNTT